MGPHPRSGPLEPQSAENLSGAGRSHDHDRWDRGEALGVPLVKLVDGLGEIAALPIPYARLPRRWRAFSEEFRLWSDIAEVTPQSLLYRPKIGESALRALSAVAREAVAAYRRSLSAEPVTASAAAADLISRLTDYDRCLLAGRVWPPALLPQNAVGAQLQVNTMSLYRNLPRAETRFAELLADPAHQAVSEYAAALGARLGSYMPAGHADDELARLDVELGSDAAALLLYVAGPYRLRGDWLDNLTADGRHTAAAATAAVFTRCPAPAPALLRDALTEAGLTEQAAQQYLNTHLHLRHFGDICVRWSGDTTANMAEAVLHALGSPATAEDIHALVGRDRTALATVNSTLSADYRFTRVSRRTWGLRSWRYPEYTGIWQAIGSWIDAHGGYAEYDTIVAAMASQYSDVAETSIKRYLESLEFFIDAGIVRRRTKHDGFPAVAPLNTARGAFSNGGNEIRLARRCSPDVLRGSGLALPPAAAGALGLEPGQRRSFTGPHGGATLTWKLSSPSGADLSSLRAHAMAVGAVAGDTLVLIFGPSDTFKVIRIDPQLSRTAQLAQLLGRSAPTPDIGLAASLDCEPHEVAAVLRRRGDDDLASQLSADATACR